jgi:hypothetical protein
MPGFKGDLRHDYRTDGPEILAGIWSWLSERMPGLSEFIGALLSTEVSNTFRSER